MKAIDSLQIKVTDQALKTQQELLRLQQLPFAPRMAQARNLHALTDYRGAIISACLAFEVLLAQRLEISIFMLLAKTPLPDKGVRILRTETGSHLQFNRQEFSAHDSECYLQFVQNFSEQLQARSLNEVVFKLLHRLSINSVYDGNSLDCKRRRLIILHKLRYYLLSSIPVAKSFTQELQSRLSRIFSEPETRINRLLEQHNFYFEFNYAKRLLHRRHSRRQQQQLNQFQWAEAEAFAGLMAADRGSIVLATIHMGDFVGAFHRICQITGSSRQTISLQRDKQNDDNNDYAMVDSSAHHAMLNGQFHPIEIVSALRSGGHILSMLFDLKDDFGASTKVSFFGFPARFVKGPAQLAVMGGVPIIPFVTYEQDGVDVIDMDELIDTSVLSGESLADAMQRITQRLIALAEKWIRANPSQWKYLLSIFSYFEKKPSQI
jgi:lauroyl/myristoyl acyltransferase